MNTQRPFGGQMDRAGSGADEAHSRKPHHKPVHRPHQWRDSPAPITNTTRLDRYCHNLSHRICGIPYQRYAAATEGTTTLINFEASTELLDKLGALIDGMAESDIVPALAWIFALIVHSHPADERRDVFGYVMMSVLEAVRTINGAEQEKPPTTH